MLGVHTPDMPETDKKLILAVRTNVSQRKILDKAAKARGLPTSTWLLFLGLEAAKSDRS